MQVLLSILDHCVLQAVPEVLKNGSIGLKQLRKADDKDEKDEFLERSKIFHPEEKKELFKLIRPGYAILPLPKPKLCTREWAMAALEGYLYYLEEHQRNVLDLIRQYEFQYKRHVPWCASRFNLLLKLDDLTQARQVLMEHVHHGQVPKYLFNHQTFTSLLRNRKWSDDLWNFCNLLVSCGAYEQAYSWHRDTYQDYYVDDIVSWAITHAPYSVIMNLLNRHSSLCSLTSTFRMEYVVARSKRQFFVEEIINMWSRFISKVGVSRATEAFFCNFHGVSYLGLHENEQLLDWVANFPGVRVEVPVEYNLGESAWMITWARNRGHTLIMPRTKEGIVLTEISVKELYARLDQLYDLKLAKYINCDLTVLRFIEDRLWFMLDAFLEYKYTDVQPYKQFKFTHHHLLAFTKKQSSSFRSIVPEPHYSDADHLVVKNEANRRVELEVEGKLWCSNPRDHIERLVDELQQELYMDWKRRKQQEPEFKVSYPVLHYYDPDESEPDKLLRIRQALSQDWERFKFVLSNLRSVEELNHRNMGWAVWGTTYCEIHPQVYRFLSALSKRVKRYHDYQDDLKAIEKERQAKIQEEQKKERESIEEHIVELLLKCRKQPKPLDRKEYKAAHLILDEFDLRTKEDILQWIQQQLKTTGRKLDDLGATIHFSPSIPSIKTEPEKEKEEEGEEKEDGKEKTKENSVGDFISWLAYFVATSRVDFEDYKSYYGSYNLTYHNAHKTSVYDDDCYWEDEYDDERSDDEEQAPLIPADIPFTSIPDPECYEAENIE